MPNPLQAKGKMFDGSKPGPGRPKGSKNPTERQRAYFRKLLESKTYREKFEADLKDRKLHPSVEVLAYYYAYGKPKDQLEVGGNVDVRIVHEFSDTAAERPGVPESDGQGDA